MCGFRLPRAPSEQCPLADRRYPRKAHVSGQEQRVDARVSVAKAPLDTVVGSANRVPRARVTSPAVHVLDRTRAAADRVTARLALIGADPRDDEDLRARKALLVLISVLILPIAAVWGALYLALGSPVGVVPLVYFGVLLGALVVFSRTRDFPWLLRGGARSTSCSRRRCR